MQNNITYKLKKLIKKLAIFLKRTKNKPLLFLGLFGILLVVLFWIVSDDDEKQLVNDNNKIEFESEEETLDGVKESVDPRDMWVANVSEKIQESSEDLTKQLELKDSDNKEEMSSLKNEITDLKRSLHIIEQKWLEEKQKLPPLHQVDDMNTPQARQIKRQTKFRHLSNNNISKINKDLKYYIPSGSFARGVLMTGVVVGTGTSSASSPEPIMIRLSHHGIFSK